MAEPKRVKVRCCDDCDHRRDCPRMRGENRCHGTVPISQESETAGPADWSERSARVHGEAPQRAERQGQTEGNLGF